MPWTPARAIRRLVPLIAGLALAVTVSACGDDNDNETMRGPTGTECSGAAQSGDECAGNVCLVLNANDQGKAGICSEACGQTGQCTQGGTCANIQNLGAFCLQTCTTDAECSDGFVCTPDGVCLVTFDNTGGTG